MKNDVLTDMLHRFYIIDGQLAVDYLVYFQHTGLIPVPNFVSTTAAKYGIQSVIKNKQLGFLKFEGIQIC